jgi:hypothetical protein
MALFEQQWIKVQEKTFTKWSVTFKAVEQRFLTYRRLNSKLKTRDIEIQDLVKDLSDGVSAREKSSIATSSQHSI